MASNKQAPAAEQPPCDGEFDPIYEWLDDGDSYLLRLNLAGFKKEDFRVHVDPAGRLTVISQPGRAPRLHKAFQLPNTANLDGIAGRFDGGVLTLTVPKLRQPDTAVAPAETKEEQAAAAAGQPKDPQEDKAAAAAPETDEKAKGTRGDKEEKAKADHKAYVEREAVRRIEAARAKLAEEAKRRTAEAEKKVSAAARGGKDKEEKDDKRKAEAAAAPRVPGEKKEADGATRRDHQDEKAGADHRAYVEREAARRIEDAWAQAKAAAERTGGQWKDRAAAEGLKLAEAIGQKKELVATAVAAFTLGVFVSQAFCRR